MSEVWYAMLEPEIREVVRALRNIGINTICSCGHELCVKCLTSDPTTECSNIYTALVMLGCRRFRITLCWDENDKICSSRILAVWLPKPDGSYAKGADEAPVAYKAKEGKP